jgi:hypothetical protein
LHAAAGVGIGGVQVQSDHTKRTRTMEDAIKAAKEIHEESISKDQDL